MYNNEFSLEFEQGFDQESAFEHSNGSFEFNQEFLGERNGETFEVSDEMNEMQELELAHELLSVSNEQELNMFLGKLIRKAGQAVGNFARSSAGKALGGVLKTVAKKALPIAGGALGTFVGGPLGGAIGSKLGSMAGNLFELELEGLSPEDREFEVARAYVRFANAATNQAAHLQRQQPSAAPQAILRTALTQAAQQHAPGLLRQTPAERGRFPASGTWTRRGRTLVIQL